MRFDCEYKSSGRLKELVSDGLIGLKVAAYT